MTIFCISVLPSRCWEERSFFIKPSKCTFGQHEVENLVADSFSRQARSPELQAISYSQLKLWTKLKEANRTDPYMQTLMDHVKNGQEEKNQYHIRDGVLFYKGRIIVSPDSPFKPLLLNGFHNTKLSGHSGVLWTYKQLAQVFFWESKCNDFQKCCSLHRLSTEQVRSPFSSSVTAATTGTLSGLEDISFFFL